MKVLAVDPGFERLGVAIVEKENGGPESVVHSACIQTSVQEVFPERLRILGEAVRSLIHTHAPEALAIETLLFNTNRATAMPVAAARGVVLYEAARSGLSVFEYSPAQIKVAVAGYGKAPKHQVADMVRALVSLDERARLDDEIDAIAVGLTHLACVRQ